MIAVILDDCHDTWVFGEGVFPSSVPGIPRALASLVRAPFVLRKGLASLARPLWIPAFAGMTRGVSGMTGMNPLRVRYASLASPFCFAALRKKGRNYGFAAVGRFETCPYLC